MRKKENKRMNTHCATAAPKNIKITLKLRCAAVTENAIILYTIHYMQLSSAEGNKMYEYHSNHRATSTHLSGLEVDGVQAAEVVLDLDGPGVVVVVVLVRNVNNGGHHVRVRL